MSRAAPVTWAEFAATAPQLAEQAVARLTGPRVALLATLRHDGAPRISPVEPVLAGAELLIGAMTWSRKVADLRRDPRFALHSTVADPDAGAPDVQLTGMARELPAQQLDAGAQGWWSVSPPDTAVVFALDIVDVALVEWSIGNGLMRVDRWSQAGGYRSRTRSYP